MRPTIPGQTNTVITSMQNRGYQIRPSYALSLYDIVESDFLRLVYDAVCGQYIVVKYSASSVEMVQVYINETAGNREADSSVAYPVSLILLIHAKFFRGVLNNHGHWLATLLPVATPETKTEPGDTVAAFKQSGIFLSLVPLLCDELPSMTSRDARDMNLEHGYKTMHKTFRKPWTIMQEESLRFSFAASHQHAIQK